jgi:pyruvate formate-lyase activating enzyme-like uncharacterized protein
MASEVSAAYVLTRFGCEPDQISEILGIQPTKAWKKGELIGKSILRRKQNGWELKIQIPDSEDLDEHITELLKKLSPAWEKVINLNQLYYAEISCVVYSYEAQGPGLHLDKKTLKQMAELNAEVDLDYYSLYEPPEKS